MSINRMYTTLLVLGGIALSGCAPDEGPTAVDTGPVVPHRVFDAQTVDGPAESIAAALAIALRDAGLRQRLLEDLRDSPFPRHRIELASYLAGERGRVLRDAASLAFPESLGDIDGALTELPSMALEVPSTLHQKTWDGREELQVVGSRLTLRERLRTPTLSAFTADGAVVEVGTDDVLEVPTLAVFPSEIDFGSDPEGTRASAPKKNRPTISPLDYEEQFPPSGRVPGEAAARSSAPVLSLSSNGAETAVPYTGVPAKLGPGLDLGFSYNDCLDPDPFDDLDWDNFDDDCERQLVEAFRPRMQVAYGDSWLSREEHWSMRTRSAAKGAARMTVHYMYSYHRDPGIVVGGVTVTEHDGDSEFVDLELYTKSAYNVWWVDEATLSSHWGTINDHTETVDGTYLQYLGSRPRIWVSKRKHGNYKSEWVCDNVTAESCDTGITADFRVYANRNIGNDIYLLGVPVGWVIVNQPSSQGYPGSENFWQGLVFAGWQTGGSSFAGPYKNSLIAYGYLNP